MNGIDIATLMAAARSLESLADLVPARYAGLADHARELAVTLTRACAAAQAGAVARHRQSAGDRRDWDECDRLDPPDLG